MIVDFIVRMWSGVNGSGPDGSYLLIFFLASLMQIGPKQSIPVCKRWSCFHSIFR